MKIDHIERRILGLLQTNGRMSNADLAEQIGISESPCYRRVKQLEISGLIKNYVAVVDQRRLGLTITAFVQVTMNDHTSYDHNEFAERVNDEPYIIECYSVSGSHDYLMKVVARNIDHFSELAMHHLLKLPGVKNIESSFSLKEIKNVSSLPTDDE